MGDYIETNKPPNIYATHFIRRDEIFSYTNFSEKKNTKKSFSFFNFTVVFVVRKKFDTIF